MSVANPNTLNLTGFIVQINRLPNVSFWANSVTLPGISVNNPQQPNPYSRIPVPADHPDFDQLSITFNVDEDLKNWTEVMRWLVGFTFPQSSDQFNFGLLDATGEQPGTNNNFYSDITVTILSSHKNPIASITYYNCVPATLSGLDMTVADQDINPISCTATFDFSYFSVNKPDTTDAVDMLTSM